MGYRAGRFGGRPCWSGGDSSAGRGDSDGGTGCDAAAGDGWQIADRPQSTSLPASASGGISAATVRGTVSVTAQRAGVRHMLDWRVNQTGSHVAIIGLGNAYPLAEQTAAALSADYGITATVIDRASARRWIQTYWSRCVMATSRSSPLKTGSLKAAGARK